MLDRFIWHLHEDTDEVFIVLAGQMTIEFRDGKVELSQGQMFVMPKGVEHRPFSEKECQILLIEPKSVVNTVWI
ncbi:cupin domain-containing protein [Enterococcus wangshanyuanii]